MANLDKNPVEETFSDIADYAQLRVDKLKLRLLDNFSTVLNRILALTIVFIMANLAMMFILGVVTMLLAKAIGSTIWALAIMAAVCIFLAAMLYLLRNKLFLNSVVCMFSKLFFEKSDDYEQ